MSRPHTYVGEYPAQNERFGIYGVSEREKCAVNLSKMGEYEVCIPKPRILVQWINTKKVDTKIEYMIE